MPLDFGYFDSVDGDRLYDADTMSRYFTGIISRGVLQTYEGGFQVTEAITGEPTDEETGDGTDTGGITEGEVDGDTETITELPVAVQPGKAYFSNGKWVTNPYAHNVFLEAPAMTLPRIDRIILKCDRTYDERNVSIVVKTGVPDPDPVPPELISTEDIEEMSLCQVYLDPGVTAITQDKIIDERPDNSVCGFVHQLFDQVSTEELFDQYDAAFENWFKNIKETVATTTLIRQYSSNYKTTAQDQTNIPINIAQFSLNIDVLNVYINGVRLINGVDYTKYEDYIILAKPVDINTQIEFEVLRSVDGSEAETIIGEVENLQIEAAKTNKFNYYCNGTNDNKLLTELCEQFVEGNGAFGSQNKLTVNVFGNFGVDTNILYDGEESKTYSLSIINHTGKELYIDFSNCDTITPKGAFMYVQDVTIKNLSIKHNNDVLDNDIYSLSGFNAVFDNCTVTGAYSGGTSTAMYLNSSRAVNCKINVTSNGMIYGFNGTSFILDNCDVEVMSSAVSAYGVSSTNARANNCNFKGVTSSTATDASGNGGIGGGSFTNCLFEGFGGLKGHGFFLRASNLANMNNCVFRGYTKNSTSGTAIGFITASDAGNTVILHGINCNQVAVTGYSQLASMNITNGNGVYDGLFYTAPTIYNAENVVSLGSYNRNRV